MLSVLYDIPIRHTYFHTFAFGTGKIFLFKMQFQNEKKTTKNNRLKNGELNQGNDVDFFQRVFYIGTNVSFEYWPNVTRL